MCSRPGLNKFCNELALAGNGAGKLCNRELKKMPPLAPTAQWTHHPERWFGGWILECRISAGMQSTSKTNMQNSLNAHWIFTECSLNVHGMFTECSLNVHWMFTECSLNVHWIFTECSLNVHWMFTECSLNVHWMFTKCSLSVHWMFSERSLNVHWMSFLRVCN
jgi:hypothetical protein